MIRNRQDKGITLVALVIIMLITTIIDIIKIASVNNDSEVNTENIVQVEDDIEDDSSED